MKEPLEYKEKFIAFIDILGFSNFVENSENGTGVSLAELIEMQKMLKRDRDIQEIKTYGPTTCPSSFRIAKDLDFKASQASDCVVISAELSPAGCINLIAHSWKIVFKLLQHGFMTRGSIVRGNIYHSEDGVFIGTGYQRVCENEKETKMFADGEERGTPFVELERPVCDYIKKCDDQCVIEMFSRFVKHDEEIAALFPFKRMAHSFLLAGFGMTFNPQKERETNDMWRQSIQRMKDGISKFVDKTNSDAVQKGNHYSKALDDQLEMCKATDEMINWGSQEYPSRRLPL